MAPPVTRPAGRRALPSLAERLIAATAIITVLALGGAFFFIMAWAVFCAPAAWRAVEGGLS